MRYLCLFLTLILLALPAVMQSLMISEVCSRNNSVIADYYGHHSDWVELYNNSQYTIDLNPYCLSDRLSNLRKYGFPANTMLSPWSYVLVWCSNDGHTVDPNGGLYTNFAIDADGTEPVILSVWSTLAIVDQFPPTSLPADISYGRIGTALDWYYFVQPTPGTANTTQGYTGFLSEPVASLPSGWYADPMHVSFTSPDPGVEIRYTLDGTEPTATSTLWSRQLTLHDRSSSPNVYSLISPVIPNPSIELDDWYPPDVSVPKIYNLKVRCFHSGAMPSFTLTRTYLVGVNLYNLPVASLSVKPSDLFNADDGMYVAGSGYTGDFYSANFFRNVEADAEATFFDSLGVLQYQKDCKIEIAGAFSCRAGQKSFLIKADSLDGDWSLNYPFFGTDYLDHFRDLILRNAGNDVHWAHFRDYLAQAILQDTGLDTSRYKAYNVFLCGEYWGVYLLQEHQEEHFLANHYDLPIAQMDLLERDATVLAGDSDDYNELMSYIAAHDVTNPEVWSYLNTRIDFDQYCEYLAAEIIAGNIDWPGNNIRFWRKRVSYTPLAPYGQDGRWRWQIYDMDYSLGLYMTTSYAFDTLTNALNPALGQYNQLLRGLIVNQNFRNQLINTIADRLNYDWAPARVLALVDSIQNSLTASMPGHIARWKLPASYTAWQNNVNALKDFAQNRPNFMGDLVVSYFNLQGKANITFQINPPEAATLKINRRIILTSGSYTYFSGIPITVQVQPAEGWEVSTFNGTRTDSLTIIPSGAQTIQLTLVPARVEGLIIHRSGTQSLLSWSSVRGASSYRVEYTNNPISGTWSLLHNTADTQLSIDMTAASGFYRVKAEF